MNYEELELLVAKASQGDEEAFADLYDYTFERFFRIAVHTVKSPEDAADVVQESMIELHRRLPMLKNAKAFVTYTNRIVYGKCMDFLRAQKKWNRAFDIETSEEELRSNFIPDENLEEMELRDAVLEQVDKLSESLRLIVLLYYYEQLNTVEISVILGIKENTVRVRLSRARRILKKNLAEVERSHRGAGLLILLTWLFAKTLYGEKRLYQRTWENICAELALPEHMRKSRVSQTQGWVPALTAGGLRRPVAVLAASTLVIISLSASTQMRQQRLKASLEQHNGQKMEALAHSGSADQSEILVAPAPSGQVSYPPAPSQSAQHQVQEAAPDYLPLSPSQPAEETSSPEDERLISWRPEDGALDAADREQEFLLPLPFFSLAIEHLHHPFGAVLNTSMVLTDTGAVGNGLQAPLQVIGLEQLAAGASGTYLLYVRTAEPQVQGAWQRVVTVQIGAPPNNGSAQWSTGMQRTQQAALGALGYELSWASTLTLPLTQTGDAQAWQRVASAVEPLVYNRLGTPLPMEIALSCPNFDALVDAGSTGSYAVTVIAELVWEGVRHMERLPITIVVQDETPPTIHVTQPHLTVKKGEPPASLEALLALAGVSAYDTVYGQVAVHGELLGASFEQIDWSREGEYGIYLYATDQWGNEAERASLIFRVLEE